MIMIHHERSPTVPEAPNGNAPIHLCPCVVIGNCLWWTPTPVRQRTPSNRRESRRNKMTPQRGPGSHDPCGLWNTTIHINLRRRPAPNVLLLKPLQKRPRHDTCDRILCRPKKALQQYRPRPTHQLKPHTRNLHGLPPHSQLRKSPRLRRTSHVPPPAQSNIP